MGDSHGQEQEPAQPRKHDAHDAANQQSVTRTLMKDTTHRLTLQISVALSIYTLKGTQSL